MTNASAGWSFVLVMGSDQCVGGLRVQCVVRMSNVLLGWPVRCVPELVSNASAWWWVSVALRLIVSGEVGRRRTRDRGGSRRCRRYR